MVVVLLVSSVSVAQVRGMTKVQQLQLQVNALGTLNAAITDVRRKADYRTSFLDKWFNETKQMAEYIKWRAEAATKEEPKPKAGNWKRDGGTVAPDRDVPLTFEDAYELAIELEIESRLDKAKSTKSDIATLEKMVAAQRKMAEKRFSETIGEVVEVERKVAFLKEVEKWDEFMDWAAEELVRRQEEEKAKKEQITKEAKERAEEKREEAKERAEQRKADKEEAERKRAEELERKWQRKAEAYQLRTERVKAVYPQPVYDYSDDARWWRHRRVNRPATR
jgi:hypothetical protein